MKQYLAIGSIVLIGFFLCWPPDVVFLDQPYSAIVEDRNGVLLSAQIADDGQWRMPIADEVPLRFGYSIVAFEDRRYYCHVGIDLLAILRAIRLNMRSGEVVSGASTIPMQLARLSRHHPPRTLKNKIYEAWLAWRLSLWYDKETILRWYVSLAPFGGNVVGLTAASWRYYGKSPENLTWAECATLAVLPNAPSLIHINRNRDALLKKRNDLLRRLLADQIIDSLDFESAVLEKLPDRIHALPSEAPHYLEYCKKKKLKKQTSIISNTQKNVNVALRDLGKVWSGMRYIMQE